MKTEDNEKRIVPDTTVLSEALLSRHIESGKIEASRIAIHESVLAIFEHSALMNRARGSLGLEEINRLRHLSGKMGFVMQFAGKRPSSFELERATFEEIDSVARDFAYESDSVLVTASRIQAGIADSKGMRFMLLEKEESERELLLETFFDLETMSVHLKENVQPFAKKGFPGKWDFVKLRNEPMSREELQKISNEIIEATGSRKDSFVEIERRGSTIVQLGHFRIVMTRPPFSDGFEITAVRPVKRMRLEEYKLSEKLHRRIAEQAEGILIAGAPGMGKSTFAQALAVFYASKGRIVKTIEAPRDMVLPDEITQYAVSHGDAREIHDILLLSRPDYSIFDEMRNTDDFRLFADMRLAGIGLAGVVHATRPIDAIQRFVGRIELGVIPQVIDTVIFIKDGRVSKVLSLNMVVKVPSGMTEADLARPVVAVHDFETKKPEFELYSYGEETVVVPVLGSDTTPSRMLASQTVEREFRNFAKEVKVEFLSDSHAVVELPKEAIPQVIGRDGKNIQNMEEKLGISIDVREMKELQQAESIDFTPKIAGKNITLYVDDQYSEKNVDIIVDGDYLMTANVGKRGILKISRKNKIGKLIADAINMKENLKLVLKG